MFWREQIKVQAVLTPPGSALSARPSSHLCRLGLSQACVNSSDPFQLLRCGHVGRVPRLSGALSLSRSHQQISGWSAGSPLARTRAQPQAGKATGWSVRHEGYLRNLLLGTSFLPGSAPNRVRPLWQQSCWLTLSAHPGGVSALAKLQVGDGGAPR